MNSLWDELVVGLDDDERIVLPQMYEENRNLYHGVVGIAYLVRSDEEDSGLDWVWKNASSRILDREDLVRLAEVYIVKLKLPWTSLKSEWLCSKKEFEEHREDLELLDIYLRVRHKDDPAVIPMINPLEFETHRDKYEVLEVRYLVCLKSHPEKHKRFLDIPGDRFHPILKE